ncbi:leucyl aminopeptidase [Corynebacterium gerontici]|uniref:Probable cytosol aminopeptidase n=1 Tax=Corynebacterium gerontici TaxID=2079234 RepID=A0A3G6J1F4_9CORY|nr:leucyl aminopeptidase [Corynebacterium gerontici]AZA11807.1 Cytosol aminopeptidase [Corynebacterium gerontici]
MTISTNLPSSGSHTRAEFAEKLPDHSHALIVALFSSEDLLELAGTEKLQREHSDALLRSFQVLGAEGKHGQLTRVPAPEGVSADFVLGVGLGEAEELNDEQLRRACGQAARSLSGVSSAAVTFGNFGMQAVVEGFLLGAYNFRGIRSKESGKTPVGTVSFVGAEEDQKEFERGVINAESVMLARDLVNTASSHLYPESYADELVTLAETYDLEVEVLDYEQLRQKGFGGIVAVGGGSIRKPRLVRLRWSPEHAKKRVALVGKGITFDTGGISIKPGASMDDMISDMGGSAAVVGTIVGAARLQLPVEVTATIPLAENMPGGGAYRPGDVITHYGGLTSEILNTDAEGRLVLADAIARASEDEPDYLIEVATLTGAQLVALGSRTAGVMGSDDFRDFMADKGNEVGENAWAMPMPEEMGEAIKSPVADLQNIARDRFGGMMVAAWYLSNFVGEGVEWVHFDIAGPAYASSAYGYTPKRGTGAPVRTFLAGLEHLAQ